MTPPPLFGIQMCLIVYRDSACSSHRRAHANFDIYLAPAPRVPDPFLFSFKFFKFASGGLKKPLNADHQARAPSRAGNSSAPDAIPTGLNLHTTHYTLYATCYTLHAPPF
jgi:hypothetical protein